MLTCSPRSRPGARFGPANGPQTPWPARRREPGRTTRAGRRTTRASALSSLPLALISLDRGNHGSMTSLPSPAPPKTRRKGPVLFALLVAALLMAVTVAVATLVIQQPAQVTPASRAPDVVWAAGDDAASLVSLGFATAPVVSGSGVSVSMTIYGIPGATSVS